MRIVLEKLSLKVMNVSIFTYKSILLVAIFSFQGKKRNSLIQVTVNFIQICKSS